MSAAFIKSGQTGTAASSVGDLRTFENEDDVQAVPPCLPHRGGPAGARV